MSRVMLDERMSPDEFRVRPNAQKREDKDVSEASK